MQNYGLWLELQEAEFSGCHGYWRPTCEIKTVGSSERQECKLSR